MDSFNPTEYANAVYIVRRLTSRGAFSAILGKHLEPKREVTCTFRACSQFERGLRIHQAHGQLVRFYPLLHAWGLYGTTPVHIVTSRRPAWHAVAIFSAEPEVQ